jgi:hypothetical protein
MPGVVLVLGSGLGALAWGGAQPVAARAQRVALTVPPPRQLPLGGRQIFPAYRVVAYAGNPLAPGLGALGLHSPDKVIRRLWAQARGYALPTRPVLPAFELIVTIAQRAPGPAGLYRRRMPAALIDRYLAAARRARALLLLDIQPGRSDFVREVRHLRRWLVEPEVGVALDPEWRVRPGQRPGHPVGSVSAQEVNKVSAELAEIVRKHDLPEKLLVLHQFTRKVLPDRARIARRPGLATTINIDALGHRHLKVQLYHDLASPLLPFRYGIKLFYKEDRNLLAPRSVMALRPRPDFVGYE